MLGQEPPVTDPTPLPDLADVRLRLAKASASANDPRLLPTLQGVADALLLLLPPPAVPGWHTVPDQEPIDGAWTAGGDKITIDPTNDRPVTIHDGCFRTTWLITPAEARDYAAQLLSAAARAEQAGTTE